MSDAHSDFDCAAKLTTPIPVRTENPTIKGVKT